MSEGDGGPAFPEPERFQRHDGSPLDEEYGYRNPGMSLRDWFAGQVPVDAVEFPTIEGAAAFMGEDTPTDDQGAISLGTRVAARIAYMYADAMLAAREDIP